MANSEMYAIFFPEADGYLFCGPLGAGAEGTTSIVRSIVDNQNYVRKKTKPTAASSRHKEGIFCAEVSLYHPHPRIPRLVHTEGFTVLPAAHPRVNEFKSSSLIFSYCNGGTLERFLTVLERERILVPEVLAWHILDQLFEALEHFHHGNPSISHNDLHEGNVYLHYPTPESRLPEVFIGDLGLARPVDQSVWEVVGNPPTRRLRNPNAIRQEDEQALRVYDSLKYAGIASENLPPQPPPRTRQAQAMIEDLKAIHSIMHRVLLGRNQPPADARAAPHRDGGAAINRVMTTDPNDYNAFVGLHQMARDMARSSREASTVLPDFQWTRQDRYRDEFPAGVTPIPPFPWTRYNLHITNHQPSRTRLHSAWQHVSVPEIRLFQTRQQLLHLSDAVPGPWKIVRVRRDGTSLQILAVETLTFGLHVPSVQENVGVTPSGRAFNGDDHHMVNQLVVTEADRIGMARIKNAAAAVVAWRDPGPYFGVDPAWDGERLSKQGQLTLRAPALLPPPQSSQPAPETPLPAPPVGPSTPRRPSPAVKEEARAAAQAPPETEQAEPALQEDPAVDQPQTPPPPPPRTPPAQKEATPPPPPPPPAEKEATPPPPPPGTPPIKREASPSPPPPPPPATPPRQQESPVARAPSPAPSHQTPPAQEEPEPEPETAYKVVKKTATRRRKGAKGAKGRARGTAAPTRSHPADRPRAPAPPPPSRVTTRSMARRQAMENIIWTRSRTRAAAAAAQQN